MPRPGSIPGATAIAPAVLKSIKVAIKDGLKDEKLHKILIFVDYVLKVRELLIAGKIVISYRQPLGFAGPRRAIENPVSMDQLGVGGN